jgi:hypothetical protein
LSALFFCSGLAATDEEYDESREALRRFAKEVIFGLAEGESCIELSVAALKGSRVMRCRVKSKVRQSTV